MIKFKEKSFKRTKKILKYYTDKGFSVSVILVNNLYNITVGDVAKKALKEG